MLLKPQTYMNDSGQAVGEALRYLKIAEGDIYVFHDEIDLAPAKLKVKAGGGNAGHNGLRSISAHIGNEYARVRIGVGHPGSKDLVSHYVLHDFAKADADWLDPMLDAMAAAAGRLAAGDAARFLTDVARALQADKGPDKNEQQSGDKPDGDCTSAAHGSRYCPSGRRAAVQARQRAGRKPQEVAARQSRPRELILERFKHGLQMRHRGPAERRQVHPLQRADADGGGGGRQLSLLHHRAQRRRRRRARSAPRPSCARSPARPLPFRRG